MPSEKEQHIHITFGEAAEVFLFSQRASGRNKAEVGRIRSRLGAHCMRYVGDVPLHKIDAELLFRLYRKLSNKNNCVLEKVHENISSIFDFTISRGFLAKENPARDLDRYFMKGNRETSVRERTAKPDEMPRIEQLLAAAATDPTLSGQAILFSATSLASLSETVHVRWADIDLDWHVLVVGGHRKMPGSTRYRPVPASLVQRLVRLQEAGTFVFENPCSGLPITRQALTARIRGLGFSELSLSGVREEFRGWYEHAISGSMRDLHLFLDGFEHRGAIRPEHHEVINRWSDHISRLSR